MLAASRVKSGCTYLKWKSDTVCIFKTNQLQIHPRYQFPNWCDTINAAVAHVCNNSLIPTSLLFAFQMQMLACSIFWPWKQIVPTSNTNISNIHITSTSQCLFEIQDKIDSIYLVYLARPRSESTRAVREAPAKEKCCSNTLVKWGGEKAKISTLFLFRSLVSS